MTIDNIFGTKSKYQIQRLTSAARGNILNTERAETDLFCLNIVNIMVAVALASCVVRTPVPMILTYRIFKFLSYTRKDLIYLCHVSVVQ